MLSTSCNLVTATLAVQVITRTTEPYNLDFDNHEILMKMFKNNVLADK